MGIISTLFPKAKKITSKAIAAEIEKARQEHADAIARRTTLLANIATMDDETHARTEADYESHRRAAERATARIAALESAHADTVAAETKAAKLAAEAEHRVRVNAARNAVEVEAADLLRTYANLAEEIAGIVTRLTEIDAEATTCSVPGIDQTHRKHPDRQAGSQSIFQPGRYEPSLTNNVMLPPAFLGPYIWPKS
jgi:hypothetical protein